MRDTIASRIMPRTTLDLDAGVLRALRRRKQRTGQSLGEVASELLAGALREPEAAPRRISWRSASMGARVDLDDKEAVRRATEGS
jgi:hypothetical protein